MAIVPPDYNNGPNGWYPPVNESLTTATDIASATPSIGSNASVQESVTDFVSDPFAALPAIPDISLTSGINTDSLFSLGGAVNNPFGDLSINGIAGPLKDAFGANFSIDDIAEKSTNSCQHECCSSINTVEQRITQLC